MALKVKLKESSTIYFEKLDYVPRVELKQILDSTQVQNHVPVPVIKRCLRWPGERRRWKPLTSVTFCFTGGVHSYSHCIRIHQDDQVPTCKHNGNEKHMIAFRLILNIYAADNGMTLSVHFYAIRVLSSRDRSMATNSTRGPKSGNLLFRSRIKVSGEERTPISRNLIQVPIYHSGQRLALGQEIFLQTQRTIALWKEMNPLFRSFLRLFSCLLDPLKPFHSFIKWCPCFSMADINDLREQDFHSFIVWCPCFSLYGRRVFKDQHLGHRDHDVHANKNPSYFGPFEQTMTQVLVWVTLRLGCSSK